MNLLTIGIIVLLFLSLFMGIYLKKKLVILFSIIGIIAFAIYTFYFKKLTFQFLFIDDADNVQESPEIYCGDDDVIPDEYDVIAQMEANEVLSFTKAASAIPNNELVNLRATQTIYGNPVLEFTFGEKMEFSNKITFSVEAQHSLVEGHKIPFNSNMLREVFHNNKGASSTSVKFTQGGLLKLEFEFKEEKTKTTYFIVRKADY